MRAFEYVSPTSKEQVAALLGDNAAILAGGTDLLALMKDDVVTPARLVNIKEIEILRGIRYNQATGLRIGALATIAELADAKSELASYPSFARGSERSGQSTDSQPRHPRREHVPAPALLVLPQRHGTASNDGRWQVDGGRRR